MPQGEAAANGLRQVVMRLGAVAKRGVLVLDILAGCAMVICGSVMLFYTSAAEQTFPALLAVSLGIFCFLAGVLSDWCLRKVPPRYAPKMGIGSGAMLMISGYEILSKGSQAFLELAIASIFLLVGGMLVVLGFAA